MIALDIYITENCWSCEEAIRLVDEVSPLFPDAEISLIDIEDASPPEEVFAVPTYVLNGTVTYLGNPTTDQLIKKLTLASSPVPLIE